MKLKVGLTFLGYKSKISASKLTSLVCEPEYKNLICANYREI